jgi:signal transduction histidine kinase
VAYNTPVAPADDRRRIRRHRLLLAAVLIPTAAVIVLVGLVARQEHELGDRRVAEARRVALEQLRRELTARLQALRLEEVNRLIGESGMRLPPDSPLVFVAPMVQDEMTLPWTDSRPSPPPATFLRHQQAGESREFQHADPAGAVPWYERALSAASTPLQRCTARLSLGRAYLKAAMAAESGRIDRGTLTECTDARDGDGVPIATYAAERLLQRGREVDAVTDYAVHAVSARRWPSPGAAYALRSLLQRLPAAASAEPAAKLSRVLHDIDQAAALARHIHAHLLALQRASSTSRGDLPWMGYGDDPWLVTLVSPTSFAAPVVIAIAPRRILPSGVRLRTTPAPESVPLGDGFVDLHVQWLAGHFDDGNATPAFIYGAVLAVVLGAGLLAALLLLRDVHRESETALMHSNFVASVSHELKTPLTSIRAHAETLLMGRAGPAATGDYLQTIVSESERLGRLVDTVLEVSRIEQGGKTYHMQHTRLDDVVRAAVRTLEYPLAQSGFTLAVSNDGTNPTLHGDPTALTQAVLNLLGNAMKYSGGARHIEIRTGTRERQAFVDVVDQGIGIPGSEQARIFERFHRVQSLETAGIAGAGLGLALVLHVVEAHHGRVDVVSDVGRGSTFSIHLPVEAQA